MKHDRVPQIIRHLSVRLLPLSLLVSVNPAIARPVLAQETQYSIRESNVPPPDTASAHHPYTAGVPVRLSRISLLRGTVQWRHGEEGIWTKATLNLPLLQGDAIRVPKGGRIEVLFEDGSVLRLGGNSLATLKTLSSDAEGNFTEVGLLSGIAALRMKQRRTLFQVNTPLVTLKTAGTSKARIGVADSVEIALREGKMRVAGEGGEAALQKGDFLSVSPLYADFAPRSLPEKDTWDLWNDERDSVLDDTARTCREHGLAENLTLAAGDLDSYGDWHEDSQYGWVWSPRDVEPGWKPYKAGQWTNLSGLGSTWVSREPWGWLPYHYGTWLHRDSGWAWVPGPMYQYWSPGVVRFALAKGKLIWEPLGPSEIQYPSIIAFGFHQQNWDRYVDTPVLEPPVPAIAAEPTLPPVVYQTTIVDNTTVEPVTVEEKTVYVYDDDDYYSGMSHYGGLGFGSGYYHNHYYYPDRIGYFTPPALHPAISPKDRYPATNHPAPGAPGGAPVDNGKQPSHQRSPRTAILPEERNEISIRGREPRRPVTLPLQMRQSGSPRTSIPVTNPPISSTPADNATAATFAPTPSPSPTSPTTGTSDRNIPPRPLTAAPGAPRTNQSSNHTAPPATNPSPISAPAPVVRTPKPTVSQPPSTPAPVVRTPQQPATPPPAAPAQPRPAPQPVIPTKQTTILFNKDHPLDLPGGRPNPFTPKPEAAPPPPAPKPVETRRPDPPKPEPPKPEPPKPIEIKKPDPPKQEQPKPAEPKKPDPPKQEPSKPNKP